MTEIPDPVIPVEVITVTVQCSTRYVRAKNARAAVAAIKNHLASRPDRYDDDEIILRTHNVRLPDDAAIPSDDSVPTPSDLMEDGI